MPTATPDNGRDGFLGLVSPDATSHSFGSAPPVLDQNSAVRAALVDAKPCKKPLPKTGASLDRLGLAAVLLAAGLAMFIMIGFKTDRPWPGRYVRRFR